MYVNGGMNTKQLKQAPMAAAEKVCTAVQVLFTNFKPYKAGSISERGPCRQPSKMFLGVRDTPRQSTLLDVMGLAAALSSADRRCSVVDGDIA